MKAKSHPETSDNTKKTKQNKKKKKNKKKKTHTQKNKKHNTKCTQMNYLNYELNQNLNRMYINENIRPFVVSPSVNQVPSLECVQSHSLQCFECLRRSAFLVSTEFLY